MAGKSGGLGGVAGRIGAEVIGEGIEAVGRTAAAGVTGAASVMAATASAAGQALGGALQGMFTKPDVVVNNFGVVGAAGKAKVAGTMAALPPITKPTATPVNDNMSTGQMVMLVVKYLSSIDTTLKNQIKMERAAYAAEQAARREQAIENVPDATKVGPSANDRVKDFGKKSTDMAMGAIKTLGPAILGIGGLYLAGLETGELDALKENISAFKDKYSYLFDFGAALAGAMAGARFGIWGAVAGAILPLILPDIITAVSGGDTSNSLKALGLGVTSFGAYKGVKGLSRTATNILELRTRPDFGNMTKSAQDAAKLGKGGASWLSGPAGRRFLAFLERKFGQAFMKRVSALLARALAGVAIASTGVGAIPGAIWTLVNLGLSAWLVYDIVKAWFEFQEEEKLRPDAEQLNQDHAANTDGTTPDATQTEAPTVSGTPPVAQQVVPQTAFDVVWANGAYGDPQRDRGKLLSQMTVNEVLEFQKNVLAPNTKKQQGVVHTPVGAYQFVYDTLKELRDKGVVNGNDIFNEQTQDKAAEYLWNENRGKNIPAIWASMPQGDYSNVSFQQAKHELAGREVGSYVGMKPQARTDTVANQSAGDIAIDVLSTAFKGIRNIGTMDTHTVNPLASVENKPDYSKINKVYDEQLKSESEAIKGLQSDNAQSASDAPQTPVEILKSLNHGSVDVINPNYMVSGQDILTKYLKYFGVVSSVGATA